jgi:sarcosine oxidase
MKKRKNVLMKVRKGLEMAAKYDVVVVGLGAMASAAAYALAARGLRVLGLDRHRPPHRHGSHHGESRIIRKAYYENPAYVPLLEQDVARCEAALRFLDRLEEQLRSSGNEVPAPVSEWLADARDIAKRSNPLRKWIEELWRLEKREQRLSN